MKILVLDPTAPKSDAASAEAAAPVAAPQRPADLAGKSVGILNNNWRSMALIAEDLSIQLKEHQGVKNVTVRRIPIAGPATDETLRQTRAEADVAIVGLAN